MRRTIWALVLVAGSRAFARPHVGLSFPFGDVGLKEHRPTGVLPFPLPSTRGRMLLTLHAPNATHDVSFPGVRVLGKDAVSIVQNGTLAAGTLGKQLRVYRGGDAAIAGHVVVDSAGTFSASLRTAAGEALHLDNVRDDGVPPLGSRRLSDTLVFANPEFPRLAGCKSEDKLFRLFIGIVADFGFVQRVYEEVTGAPVWSSQVAEIERVVLAYVVTMITRANEVMREQVRGTSAVPHGRVPRPHRAARRPW